MSTIVKPNTFSAGATIIAAEHNDNFDTIINDYNGSISNANIASNAAISDTKLNTISTANKVNGTALTGLANINTATAGTIPDAVIGTGSLVTYIGTKFNTSTGHDHDGVDSKKVSGSLGVWADLSTSYAAQQAATDGFVLVVYLGTTGDISGFTDSSNPPTTLRLRIYHPTGQTGMSPLMPVRITLSGSTVSFAVYWIPIGS
jgi:hypothetical protein